VESLVCTIAGLGVPMAWVRFEVTTWRAARSVGGADTELGGVAIRVVRDPAAPGDDRTSRNATVAAGLLGGTISFHPDQWQWCEAELRLPGAFAAARGSADVRSRRPEHV
jgi:hypothetical protein